LEVIQFLVMTIFLCRLVYQPIWQYLIMKMIVNKIIVLHVMFENTSCCFVSAWLMQNYVMFFTM